LIAAFTVIIADPLARIVSPESVIFTDAATLSRAHDLPVSETDGHDWEKGGEGGLKERTRQRAETIGMVQRHHDRVCISKWYLNSRHMEGKVVSKIVRFRLFLALGLIAAIFVAAAPHSVGAAGGPTVMTTYFYPGGVCSVGGDESTCKKTSDDEYKHLKVVGKYFTPNHIVEVKIIYANNHEVLSDVTVRADAQGRFAYRYNIKLCQGGKKLMVVAWDRHTGRQSNVANAFKCGPTL
jgi:hypothetical protein